MVYFFDSISRDHRHFPVAYPSGQTSSETSHVRITPNSGHHAARKKSLTVPATAPASQSEPWPTWPFL